MKKNLIHFQTLAILAASVLTTNFALAQSIWTNSSGNWSVAGNWLPNAVPGAASSVQFANNVGAATSAGTVDNTVDASFDSTGGTIASLQFANTNTSGGAGFYHTTQIGAGQTLTVLGSLTAGSLPDLGSQCQVSATFTGAGILVVSNLNADVDVSQGSATTGTQGATLDMSTLNNFNATIGGLEVGVEGPPNPTVARQRGFLYLAKTNTINMLGFTPRNYPNESQIEVGEDFGNGPNTTSLFYLGLTNGIYADSITIGGDKASATPLGALLAFNPIFTNSNPSAYIRGTNGNTSRVSTWIVADNSNQTTSGTKTSGTVDLSNGSLDAMVNAMIIGEGENGPSTGTGNGTGIFTFSSGTLNVNTLYLGYRIATGGSSAPPGTMNVNGTATLVVNNAICLSYYVASSGSTYALGTLNINGGTVLANAITNGVSGAANSTANIQMTGGTLGLTSLSGSIGTFAAPIINLGTSNSVLQLPVSGSQDAFVSTLTTSGTMDTINISSVPVGVITYPTQISLVGYHGSIGGSGFDFVIGSLPGTYQGYISNNTANSSIDLVLTNGPTSITTLEWKGSAGANWDTTSANWLNGVSTVAYSDGVGVLFDDNATGPTAVNLTATRSPASMTVSNNTLPYAFFGSGIGVAPSLTKDGSGTLLFTNAGSSFLGGITINAGTVQFGAGGTNGVLLASGSVIDNGNLIFNNNNNDTVQGAISGAGTLTKNGNNILTLTGSGSFSGNTVVNAGTLLVNGVLSGSLTNVQGTTIGGSGINSGSVNVSGLIQPSAVSGTPATFTSGNLNLSSGATLQFTLNGTSTTVGSGVNDLLSVGGNLNVNNNAISLNINGFPQAGSTYTLVNFSGTQNGSFNSTITGTHFGPTLNQGTSPVTVTLGSQGANLTWDSTSSGTWDVGTTSNWLNQGSSLQDVFYQGDNVLFDDSVAGEVTNVIIGAGVKVYPTLITVNSTNNNFSFGGSGTISGKASINKFGLSTLTISNISSDFGNIIQVLGGTLKVGANNALGDGIEYVYPGATLDLNGKTLASSIGIAGSIVNNGFVSGGDVNAFVGGYIYFTGNTTFGCNNLWEIRSGTLVSGDGNPWNITIVGTNEVILAGSSVDDYLGNIDIQSGTLGIQTTTLSGSLAWANDPTHIITVESNATLEFNLSAITPLGQSLVFNNGSALQNDGADCFISGTETLQGNATINNQGTATIEMEGVISGSGGFTKIGGTSLTLTASNTYTGNTLVNAGTLQLGLGGASAMDGSISSSSNIIIAAGAVLDVSQRDDQTLTLASGQTLQGNGTVNGILLVGAGATVSAGANSAFMGQLTVMTNTTTLGGTALMKINATTGANDQIVSTNGIAYGGTLIVTNLSGIITNGQSFQLFVSTNYTGTFSGGVTLPAATGLTWTNNLAVNGTIIAGVVSGPAAQPHITGVNLSGTNLVINGTNGTVGRTFYVLTSTNLVLPLSQWKTNATGTFNSGTFSVTNTVSPGAPQNFYLLKVP